MNGTETYQGSRDSAQGDRHRSAGARLLAPRQEGRRGQAPARSRGEAGARGAQGRAIMTPVAAELIPAIAAASGGVALGGGIALHERRRETAMKASRLTF